MCVRASVRASGLALRARVYVVSSSLGDPKDWILRYIRTYSYIRIRNLKARTDETETTETNR